MASMPPARSTYNKNIQTKAQKEKDRMLLAAAKQQYNMSQGLMRGDRALTNQYLGLGYDASPEDYARARAAVRNEVYTPPAVTQAAKGGIMQARGYAKGGLSSTQKKRVLDINRAIQNGTATQDQINTLNSIEGKTGINVSPYTNQGTRTAGDPKIAKSAAGATQWYQQNQVQAGGNTPFTSPSDLEQRTPGMRYDPNTGNMVFTDPDVLAAQQAIRNNQMPSEFGQASGMYSDIYSGLGGLTGFQPERISGSGWGASAQQADAAQMAAIKDIEAMKMKYYQMEGKVPEVTTKDLEAYQMAGPGSWTDEGVASKYMSPYMQGVVDISKREAGREFQKQQNEMASKAARAGAFGGARQALEKAEAQRNYNQQLEDIQTKGMQSAYESGRSQYGQELNLSQQAALQNLQSKLSTQSQSSQERLQAMLSNQNIDFQTKVQNLAANLGVQQQEAANMLQAAMANQQTQYNVGATNAQMQNQANLMNAQLGTQANLANSSNALQAAMANQQAGIAGAGVRLNAYGHQQNAAQGILGAGTAIGGWNQQQIGNLGNLANANLTWGQNWGQTAQQNAQGRILGWQQPLGGIGTTPAGNAQIPV